MSFDWASYIKLAEELAKQPHESYWRSSVSRAYYGVFCTARDRKDTTSFSGGKIHEIVINSYKNSSNSNEQYIGFLLDKLRKSRNQADYDGEKRIDKDIAERAVVSAKNILWKLNK